MNKHVGILHFGDLRVCVAIEDATEVDASGCRVSFASDKTYTSVHLTSKEARALSSLLGAAHRTMLKHEIETRRRARVRKARAKSQQPTAKSRRKRR